MTLDKNLTIWQRIQRRVEPLLGREQADEVATALLPLVLAEKEASKSVCSLVPVHMLNHVSIMSIQNRCGTHFASLNKNELVGAGDSEGDSAFLGVIGQVGFSHTPILGGSQ